MDDKTDQDGLPAEKLQTRRLDSFEKVDDGGRPLTKTIEEKNTEDFSFDSIWDKLPHISLYQDRVIPQLSKISPSIRRYRNDRKKF